MRYREGVWVQMLMYGGNRKKTVFVGLSGGVDSSVAAALLKNQGFNVVGVFIKVWQPDFANQSGVYRDRLDGSCTWRRDRLDAMRVAAKLDIPFLTLDLEKEYKEHVVDYMVKEYRAGRTPNPDVMCNKHIKFGVFFRKAMQMGADFVATGHYAHIVKRKRCNRNEYALMRGVDENKDQSYFLWTLTQHELSRTIFPVGCYKKMRVRKIAARFGLPTALKKDSQGLCFMGKINLRKFLSAFIPEKAGVVVDESGDEIGWHYGAYFYTLGQRHGFTVTRKKADNKPYFVIKKDIKNNILVVSHKSDIESKQLARGRRVFLNDVNWISSVRPDDKKVYTAVLRYRQQPQECRVYIREGMVRVDFSSPQLITPGQSIVLYDGSECIGGGVV